MPGLVRAAESFSASFIGLLGQTQFLLDRWGYARDEEATGKSPGHATGEPAYFLSTGTFRTDGGPVMLQERGHLAEGRDSPNWEYGRRRSRMATGKFPHLKPAGGPARAEIRERRPQPTKENLTPCR